MTITYNDFEKHLINAKNIISFQESIRSICNEAYKNSMDCDIAFPTLIDDVIELLSLATDDNAEWISYWVYELECGKRYVDGVITDGDGNPIKLKTIRDLWNCIKEGDSS